MDELNVNKVVIGNTVRLDLTEDTVTPETLLEGFTAHDSTGSVITGEAKQKESVMTAGVTFASIPAVNDAKAGGTSV
ncbi:MAG: hypothetical protein II820_05600 [Ruminiclostridium sp.]|nr:hypothetical protein [Ruminiclostridium sp.]